MYAVPTHTASTTQPRRNGAVLDPFSRAASSVQWNPSCEATPFALEKLPFKRGGLSSGVEINTFVFRFTLSSRLSS